MPEIDTAPLSQSETDNSLPASSSTPQGNPPIFANQPTCRHTSSLSNAFIDWGMRPYEVKKDGRVIEEGFACPKCHKLRITYKKA
jgi:hypothetical protein